MNPTTGNITPEQAHATMLKILDYDYSNRRKFVLENYVKEVEEQ